jgi:predicted ester cyclase
LTTEEDKVVTRWTATGTRQGEFMGMPPTGKPVRFSGIYIYRIAGGRIAEIWVSLDALGLMQQLGAIPKQM